MANIPEISRDSQEILKFIMQKTKGLNKTSELTLLLSVKSMINLYLDDYVKNNLGAAKQIEEATLKLNEGLRSMKENSK